jgi:hypothetical protein
MSRREDQKHQKLMEIENKKLEASQESSQAIIGAL